MRREVRALAASDATVVAGSADACASAHPTATRGGIRATELMVAGLALLALLVAQWMLSSAIPGTNYYGNDGRMAEATILAALRFGGWFHVNNINPIEGVGSQLLTMNVWANPASWPFAWLAERKATNVSALIALGCLAVACYVMVRCFDLPVVPSAIAAQLCILLFAPSLLIFMMPTVFCATPANAVVYAPHLVALGLLARIEPGSWRRFAGLAAGIFALLLYNLYCDPLWTMVSGISWAAPFAVVTFGALRRRTIALRIAALGCSVVLLAVSGAAEYLYTLSQYTARVQFAAALDRPHIFAYVSAASYSPDIYDFYYYCVPGWLLGLVFLRGRPRLLVAATLVAFGVYLAMAILYLLLDAPWTLPIPLYMEHALCPLYLAGAVAGYWGAVCAVARAAEAAALAARTARFKATPPSGRPAAGKAGAPAAGLRLAATAAALAAVAIVPARAALYAVRESAPIANVYNLPWPNEPELGQFFSDRVGLAVGQPYRGAVDFWDFSEDSQATMEQLWQRNIHTIDEYSQLVTPPAVYFINVLLKQNVAGALNGFVPYVGPSWDIFANAMQMFGARYFVLAPNAYPPAEQAGLPHVALPQRPPDKPESVYHIYEFLRPNTGNYSPTEVLTAESGADIMARIGVPGFDYTRQVVLSAPVGEKLSPARDMQLIVRRGGLHVSGKSDGTSLVILPLQFSHCLQADDPRVRFVRANLLMAGLIFSGELDTDVRFGYGIFSPRCRRVDLADVKRLDLKVDLRMPHLTGNRLFPDRHEAWRRLREAVGQIW